MKYRKNIQILFFGLLLVFVVELVLRYFFGFCDTVLMQANKNYEYIAQPNQSRVRFGNHIAYNSLSMRNEELDSSAIKVLCFGDSVINGGVLTGQDSLATTMLSSKISKFFHQNVQFLNISAGSWGPDNCFAYLEEHGNFEAKLILLFVNSHDAYDTMDFDEVIDVHKSFPSHQYALAIYELWDRYILPRILKFEIDSTSTDEFGIDKKRAGDKFNLGFEKFIRYSKINDIPLIVYLHAEKSELQKGHYNNQGQQIIELFQDNEIPIIKDLNLGLDISHFRDGIHLNSKGQKNIKENVFEAIISRGLGSHQN